MKTTKEYYYLMGIKVFFLIQRLRMGLIQVDLTIRTSLIKQITNNEFDVMFYTNIPLFLNIY